MLCSELGRLAHLAADIAEAYGQYGHGLLGCQDLADGGIEPADDAVVLAGHGGARLRGGGRDSGPVYRFIVWILTTSAEIPSASSSFAASRA